MVSKAEMGVKAAVTVTRVLCYHSDLAPPSARVTHITQGTL